MKRTKLAAPAVLTMLALVHGIAVGSENCPARWSNVLQSSEAIDLGKGMKLVTFTSRSSSIFDDKASPLSGVGMCGGYALTTPDGKTRVGYSCARKNKDGDAWSDAGTLEPGAERGSWKIVGGTGALAGKTGSGWWQQTLSDGKVTVGISNGTCD